jgi:hypothetical protein
MNTITTAFIMDLPDLPDFPESHLRAVENKITYLQASAHVMKVYRNVLVSMSRLLTVILCIIFSLLPFFEVLDFEPSPQILTSSVSHVCDRWREISLNLPYYRACGARTLPAGRTGTAVRNLLQAPTLHSEDKQDM